MTSQKRRYSATNQSNGRIIGTSIRIADSFISRAKGLLGKGKLLADEGLLITNCRQVHMFLMKFPLDLIFLDKELGVIFIEKNKKPWTISKLVPKAYSVLEVASGTISLAHIYVGDKLTFE